MKEHAIRKDALSVLEPLKQWSKNCHSASLKLVQSKVLGPCRVSRGACIGVGAQHSWVTLGMDCYSETAFIVDPTLWSYDPSVKGIWIGTIRDGRHTPKGGSGSIWTWGRPQRGRGRPIKLTPELPFSRYVQSFLELLGPLDAQGWMSLMSAPVHGWPSREIIQAMSETKKLKALIPIDLLGMLTNQNPSGLYL